MKYWENGFYLEQNAEKTRVEITDERWQELLEGNSNGLEIYTKENGEPDLRERVQSTQELNYQEYIELKHWFDNYYAQHEQKLRRLIALGKLTDDKKDPNEVLLELYEEAETKRKRIQKLEKSL